MTLLRRRPREVYRVYSEEEYLNGAELDTASIGECQLGESSLGEPPVGESPLSVETVRLRAGGEYRLGRAMEERRLHRMAGVAMLAAALGTVGGVVFRNVARAHDIAGTRGRLLAATHSSRVARSPAVDDAQAQVGSSRPAVVHSVKTTPRSPVVHVRRSLGEPDPRRSNRLLTHPLPVRRRTNVAVLADYGPRPSSGEVSAVLASASTQVSTTTASVSARPARETRAEFGFER
jgi:hypothetical protein